MSTPQDPPNIQFTPELCERLINMEEDIELSNVSPSLEGIPVPTRPYDYESGFEDGQSEAGLAAELAEDDLGLRKLIDQLAEPLIQYEKWHKLVSGSENDTPEQFDRRVKALTHARTLNAAALVEYRHRHQKK